jgi:hypothetical protein
MRQGKLKYEGSEGDVETEDEKGMGILRAPAEEYAKDKMRKPKGVHIDKPTDEPANLESGDELIPKGWKEEILEIEDDEVYVDIGEEVVEEVEDEEVVNEFEDEKEKEDAEEDVEKKKKEAKKVTEMVRKAVEKKGWRVRAWDDSNPEGWKVRYKTSQLAVAEVAVDITAEVREEVVEEVEDEEVANKLEDEKEKEDAEEDDELLPKGWKEEA